MRMRMGEAGARGRGVGATIGSPHGEKYAEGIGPATGGAVWLDAECFRETGRGGGNSEFLPRARIPFDSRRRLTNPGFRTYVGVRPRAREACPDSIHCVPRTRLD